MPRMLCFRNWCTNKRRESTKQQNKRQNTNCNTNTIRTPITHTHTLSLSFIECEMYWLVQGTEIVWIPHMPVEPRFNLAWCGILHSSKKSVLFSQTTGITQIPIISIILRSLLLQLHFYCASHSHAQRQQNQLQLVQIHFFSRKHRSRSFTQSNASTSIRYGVHTL